MNLERGSVLSRRMKGMRLAESGWVVRLSYSMKAFALAVVLGGSAMAEPGAATALFNGKDLSGWTAANGGKPGKGWKIEDGVIHRAEGGGDLVSEKEYADFELEFEWKISKGGNSGVKYRLRKTPAGWIGAEYQVLDDSGHPNGKVADTATASLYEVAPAAKDKPLNPPGKWNKSKVIAKGNVLEHWLNGKLVLKADTGTPEWADQKKASKFAKVEGFAEAGPGRILLQDHGDEVWFRGIQIREL
jgi:hypothetical protein